MLNLFNSLFGRYNENIKANVEIYLKCRLEGTLGFTSEMKGSASIEQRSTTVSTDRLPLDSEAVRNLNCLLRRGKRQEAKGNSKGIGASSANLRISGLNLS